MTNLRDFEDSNQVNMFENSEVWYQIIDSDGRVLYLNNYAKELIEYSGEKFINNHSFWEKTFTTQQIGSGTLNTIREAIQNEKNLKSKISEITSRTGKIKQLCWSMNIAKANNGKVVGAIIIGFDHTDFVVPEKSPVSIWVSDYSNVNEGLDKLRLSKNQLVSLISSMDDLVFILNRQGRYEYVAPTRPELLMSSADKLMGKYIHEFFEADFVNIFLEKIGECLDKVQTVSLDYFLEINNKGYWFEAKLSPVTDNSIIVVARDVTDRIVSRRIDEVMLSIAKAVSTTDDLRGFFDLVRAEISKLIDTKNFFIALFDSQSNTLSLPYFKDEKDDFDDFPAERTLSSLVIKEKRSLLLCENDIVQLVNDGSIVFVGTAAKVWLGIPLMVEGAVLGLMVVQNYDSENAIREEHQHLLEMISPQISLTIQRKQSEQLLKKSERDLRESNLTKDRFFNIIAHDLKNPFNAIIGFTTLLSDEWNEFDDDDKISMISSIKSSSEGAYELLMNLLEWSRLRVGKMAFNPQFIDFSSLIRLNFSLLRTIAEKKKIKLTSTGICNKMVWVDPNMVKTIIRNLLTNAIKFTSENGTINVECTRLTEHPDMIVLVITDNGIGISPDSINNIFSLSKSESKYGTGGETGTGLGLVLCKEFVEKNKGKIWVESEEGKGSAFFVALPVRPD